MSSELFQVCQVNICPESCKRSQIYAGSIPAQGKKVNKEFLLLMELCSGGDLAQLLRKTGERLNPSNVCVVVVMGSLARAL